nr:PhaM family polyhydroxyalkanoate granule multifunctional regulatory protein [Aromatoleum aromaticum]
MWSSMGFSLPGMVTPTLDVDELDKRIADLKAVENWLKMNLNMLQMTIQGLEMQRVAIATMQAMTQQAREATENPGQQGDNPFAAAAMWPWNLMGGTPPAADEPSPPPERKKAEPKPSAATAKSTTQPK